MDNNPFLIEYMEKRKKNGDKKKNRMQLIFTKVDRRDYAVQPV